MSGIQLVLLTGLAFISLYFIIRQKRRILDIVLLAIMIIGAATFILWPELTNIVAARFGVGRGADLVFYICILIFWFVVLKLYAHIRRLEQMLTQIIREDALNKAKDITNKP
ncbi:DUF2304 domain-containing protein [Paraflavitalea speifideaquila]|uniref:DUF2304 domain-containing protein n=1 Tax=Paraflavitalea speifideaquila TaxID=3076558 RepID=UPI0028ED6BA6|nr:DUF2304 domain-containing protein [Paraflavitalea speifideiaquila]